MTDTAQAKAAEMLRETPKRLLTHGRDEQGRVTHSVISEEPAIEYLAECLDAYAAEQTVALQRQNAELQGMVGRAENLSWVIEEKRTKLEEQTSALTRQCDLLREQVRHPLVPSLSVDCVSQGCRRADYERRTVESDEDLMRGLAALRNVLRDVIAELGHPICTGPLPPCYRCAALATPPRGDVMSDAARALHVPVCNCSTGGMDPYCVNARAAYAAEQTAERDRLIAQQDTSIERLREQVEALLEFVAAFDVINPCTTPVTCRQVRVKDHAKALAAYDALFAEPEGPTLGQRDAAKDEEGFRESRRER